MRDKEDWENQFKLKEKNLQKKIRREKGQVVLIAIASWYSLTVLNS